MIKATDGNISRIEAKAQEYLEAMQVAKRDGGKLENYLDADGVDALQKVMISDKQRTIQVEGQTDTVAALTIAALLHMDSSVEEDRKKRITVKLNSSNDFSIDAAEAITTTLNKLGSAVVVVAASKLASMGEILLAAGDYKPVPSKTSVERRPANKGPSV